MKSIATIAAALLFAAVLAPAAGFAAELAGRVVAVSDGDTITVLDAGRKPHKVRLSGIDAPESRQAFGTRSTQSLAKQVFDRQVSVEWGKHDRYGRIVGVVFVDGRDVNLAQVRAGLAWWYRQYAREQAPDDRQLYEAAENEAKVARRGLWADPQPVPPWAWRRAGRNAD